MKFKNYQIDDRLKASIALQGWNRPSDIQFKVIQPILEGQDVLAIAQTGTGKTAGFVIPTIQMILQNKTKYNKSKAPSCLVMVPTRELATQILAVYEALSNQLNIHCITIHGGVLQDPQMEKLKKGVDIVIATPGRLFDLCAQGMLDLSAIKTLVLDEADHLLKLGFLKDMKDLMRHIPQRRQTLFFSATIDKEIKKVAYDFVRNAIRIQISPKDPVSKNVTHAYLRVEMDDKRYFLENIVKENEGKKILVFVRTKVRAERVKKAMERVQIGSSVLHGGVEQIDRFSLLNQFKSGEVQLLIATDVAARGIDIPGVEIVINYDLPEQAENYVHRIGRTGRGREKGVALSFCSSEEKQYLQEIEEWIGKSIPEHGLTKSEYTQILADTEEEFGDWKSLLAKEENQQKKRKSKKKK
ncbi:MAG: DEAD/DEAH box helicase [Crocinitomicaceae bacterium]|nr:DEAD/DEAH box helicase [Crocinitomicaceae bacterium]